MQRHRLPLSACRSKPFGPCSASVPATSSAPTAVPGPCPACACLVRVRAAVGPVVLLPPCWAPIPACSIRTGNCRGPPSPAPGAGRCVLDRGETLGGDDLLAVECRDRDQAGVDRHPVGGLVHSGAGHQDRAGAAPPSAQPSLVPVRPRSRRKSSALPICAGPAPGRAGPRRAAPRRARRRRSAPGRPATVEPARGRRASSCCSGSAPRRTSRSAAQRAVPPASDGRPGHRRPRRRLGPRAGAHPGAEALGQPGAGHRAGAAATPAGPARPGVRPAGRRAGRGGRGGAAGRRGRGRRPTTPSRAS
ncbi:hypothetical protein STENM327S_07297 [Streptomyces tendae]